jgi:hypothetical protein
MGQFYKGAEATFIDDAMFKLPYELMGTVIDKKDKEVEGALSANTELNSLIDKISALSPDEPRANEIRQGYSSQIEAITNAIYSDPMNATTYMPKINSLKKQIGLDFTSGEVSKIEANKASYDIWEKELKEKIKSKPEQYPPDVVKDLTSKKLGEYKMKGGLGYKPSGDFTEFETEEAIGLEDSADILKGLMEGSIKGHNKSTSWNNDKGGWTVKSDTSEEFYTPDQLQNMWVNHLSTNPNIVSAVGQRKSLGYGPYQKSFDDKGSVSFEEGSWFKTAMDQLQEKYGGHKTTQGGGSTMNTLGYGIEKDKYDTVNLTTEVGGVLSSMAGTDNTQFNTAYQSTTNNQNQAVNKALQSYADLYYKSTQKDPIKAANDRLDQFRTGKSWKTYEQIRKGDFTPISNTPVGKASATQYKRAQVDRAVLQGQITQFEKETGLSHSKITTDNNPNYTYVTEDANGKKVTKKGTAAAVWDNYLTHNSTKTVNRQMSWEGTGYTAPQQKNVANQFFKSGKYMDTKIYYAPGTKIGGVDVGGASHSINDLIAKGVIKQKQVEPGGYKDGMPIMFQSVGGNESINLDTSERNFTPVWGYSDSDNIEFGFGVSVGGKTHFGRVEGVSTEATRKLNSGDNALRFKTNAYLDKNAANLENFSIPNSNYTYHGKEVKVNGRIIYPANSVTRKNSNGTSSTITNFSSHPDIQVEVGHLIFN